MSIEYVDDEPLNTQEDCLELQADEDARAKCEHYKVCWGELPWDAANAEYDRSRGV